MQAGGVDGGHVAQAEDHDGRVLIQVRGFFQQFFGGAE